MAESLSGKTALVTGAARRIGREIALAFAREGTDVVVHFNTADEDAGKVCAEIGELGVKSWLVQGDFTSPEEYETLIERTLIAAGGLDVLVNNASCFPEDTIETLTFDRLSHNIQVNAWAPFVLSRAFKHQVGRGNIVNVLDSPVGGYDWTHVGYILSKQMLETLTRMTALEFAPEVRVNAVAPGLILPPAGEPDSYVESLAQTVPLKKRGDPREVADAVVYLAKSDFVTGEIVYVDGGGHLRAGKRGDSS